MPSKVKQICPHCQYDSPRIHAVCPACQLPLPGRGRRVTMLSAGAAALAAAFLLAQSVWGPGRVEAAGAPGPGVTPAAVADAASPRAAAVPEKKPVVIPKGKPLTVQPALGPATQ